MGEQPFNSDQRATSDYSKYLNIDINGIADIARTDGDPILSIADTVKIELIDTEVGCINLAS
jgi:hypothetical protein